MDRWQDAAGMAGRWLRCGGVVALAVTCLAGSPVSGQTAPAVERPHPPVTDVRVETALAQAEQLRASKDYDKALDALRAASAFVKKSKGNDHPDLLPILDMAGQILFEQGKRAEAEVPLTRAVAIRQLLIEQGEAAHEVPQAVTLLLLGKIHASAKRVDRMVDTMKKAVAMLDAAHGPEHEATLQARNELIKSVDLFRQELGADHEVTIKAEEELAAVQESLGDHAAAAASRQQQYAAQARRLSAGHAATLQAAADCARALARTGDWAGAIALAKRAAEEATADAGADRRQLAETYRALAGLQLAFEEYSPAEESLRRARDIDADLPDNAAGLAIDELLGAMLASARGEFDPTAESFQRVVAEVRTMAAEGQPHAARGLRLASGLLLEAGRIDEARELARLAEQSDEKHEGVDQLDVGEDLLLIARSLNASGDSQGASEVLKKALRIARKIHGPSHPLCLIVVAELASAAATAQQTDDALALVRRLLERRYPIAGKKADEQTARLIDRVATLVERAGRQQEADALREDFIRLRGRQFGPQHPFVAEAYVNLANARQAAGAYGRAIELYRKGIELQEASLGPGHPAIAAALLPLARAHRALKQHTDAVRVLTRALGIWEQTAGPDAAVTLATVKSLALAELGLEHFEAAVPLMERLLAGYERDPGTPGLEKAKLLTKLAELRCIAGEHDGCRRFLKRAVDVGTQLREQESAGDALVVFAEVARVQRLLGDSEDAEANLATARSLAAATSNSAEQLRRIETIVHAPALGSARKPAENK